MAGSNKPSAESILKEQTNSEALKKIPSVTDRIDQVSQQGSVGNLSSAIGESFFGLNHRQTPSAIPINKDYFGYTFFTRPALNFSTANLRGVRELMPLLTNNMNSVPAILRLTLDPQLARNGFTSAFHDRQQAFIPILSNHLLSMSGWPDVVAPMATSPEGVYKESHSMVDGLTKNYSTYDITASFRNLPGDPITAMFLFWCHYMSLAFQGRIVPYPKFIVQNRLDCNTRIFRLVMDSTKTKVQKIASTIATPMSAPIGAAFNFEADRPINNSNDQITIPFRCHGAEYQDDILAAEFNRVVERFNGNMQDNLRDKKCKMLAPDELTVFNRKGCYPRINENTSELEWWVPMDVYNLYQQQASAYKQLTQSDQYGR